jgi:hypothetical protein
MGRYATVKDFRREPDPVRTHWESLGWVFSQAGGKLHARRGAVHLSSCCSGRLYRKVLLLSANFPVKDPRG